MPAPPTEANARGEIVTELLDARVLVTSMRGYVSASLSEAALDEFRAHAESTSAAPWIIDTLDITGFHPSAVQVGARWFDVYKNRGGGKLIMVSTMSAVRMAAATLAFAVHIKVTSCRTLAEAYAHANIEPRVARPSAYSLSPPKTGAG